MINMPIDYKKIQSLFDELSKKEFSPEEREPIDKLYENLHQEFEYLDLSDESKNEFAAYFSFFKNISESEDPEVTNEELAKRAYIALVLFGGCDKGKECETLQRYISGDYSKAQKPIHDAFATIQIERKSQNVDLIFWRQLVSGNKIKKAIQLFASASSIANKFGPGSPTSKSYELILTKNVLNKKNTKPAKLYIYTNKKLNEDEFGYAYLDDKGNLVNGTLKKDDLPLGKKKIEEAFANKKGGGDLSEHTLDVPCQNEIFKIVKIARRLTLSDIGILVGQLTYARFQEHSDLAGLCRQYKIPESVFEKCLALLPEKKQKDNLPDITTHGDTLSQDCHGYVLTKLPNNDPRAFLLGHITNCCQSIGGHSEQCVIDGWRREDNGFYVLLKRKGRHAENVAAKKDGDINYDDYDIVGQAYAWRSINDNLVFDSWENLRTADDGIAITMLKAFSDKAISESENDIFRITIGTGGKTPAELKNRPKCISAEMMMQGYQYGDSKSQIEIQRIGDQEKWKKDVESVIDNISGLSSEQKKQLKDFAPLSMHYIKVLELAENDKTIRSFFKKALTNEKFLPDMLSAMTALYVRFGVDVMKSTLSELFEIGLSTEKLITVAEKLNEEKDDEEVEEEEEIDEHGEEAEMADEPGEVVVEIPRDFVSLSMSAAIFLMELKQYGVDDSNRKSALAQYILMLNKAIEYDENNTLNLNEIFRLLIHADLLQKQPEQQKSILVQLSSLIHNAIQLNDFLNINVLTTAQRTQIFDAVKDNLKELIRDGWDLNKLLANSKLTPEQHTQIWDAVKDNLKELIRGKALLEKFLDHHALLPEERTQILNAVEDELKEFIESAYHLHILLINYKLTEEQRSQIWSAVKDNLKELIRYEYDLRDLLNNDKLEPAQRTQILDAVKDNLKELIRNEYDLRELLNNDKLTPKQHARILNAAPDNLKKKFIASGIITAQDIVLKILEMTKISKETHENTTLDQIVEWANLPASPKFYALNNLRSSIRGALENLGMPKEKLKQEMIDKKTIIDTVSEKMLAEKAALKNARDF